MAGKGWKDEAGRDGVRLGMDWTGMARLERLGTALRGVSLQDGAWQGRRGTAVQGETGRIMEWRGETRLARLVANWRGMATPGVAWQEWIFL